MIFKKIFKCFILSKYYIDEYCLLNLSIFDEFNYFKIKKVIDLSYLVRLKLNHKNLKKYFIKMNY